MAALRIRCATADTFGGIQTNCAGGCSNIYRARFQYQENGNTIVACGPYRVEKRQAAEDFESMRMAFHDQESRRNLYEAPAAEGRRLQQDSDFEGVVAVTANGLESRASLDQFPSSQSLDYDDTQSYESQDYYNDVDEIWQDIDEDGRLPDSTPAPSVSVPTPMTVAEATAALSKFRPAKCTPEDLQKILDARADPNIVVAYDIHALLKVYTFANRDRVASMREALLRAGAVENDDIKERWAIRQRADASEDAWMRNFHRDPR